ncbi:MAG: hypothetical protein WC728_02975 [Elusimicrobiota bacterium]
MDFWRGLLRIIGSILFIWLLWYVYMVVTGPYFSNIRDAARAQSELDRRIPDLARVRELGPQDRAKVVDRLSEVARKERRLVRYAALKELAKLGPAALPVLPTVLGLIHHEDNILRHNAVCVLESMAQVRTDPALGSILLDDVFFWRTRRALLNIDSEQARQALAGIPDGCPKSLAGRPEDPCKQQRP